MFTPCVICGKQAQYKHPEYPEQRICRACKNRLGRHARGLQKVGPKPDPTKWRSRHNPDNPRRLKVHPDKQRRPRSDPATYETCVRGHLLVDGKCKPCALIYQRRHKYGAEPERLEKLLEAQDYRCAICRSEFVVREADLDHNHETGQVRGFLCMLCNRGIGQLRDDPAILQAAIDYLNNPPGASLNTGLIHQEDM